MVQKVNLSKANRAKSSVRGNQTATPKGPSISSSASDLEPLVNLGIVFENDLLDLNKAKKGTREDYFKDHEKHLAKLFRLELRTSSSDTRPDIYLTSSQIDKLLSEKYGTSDYKDDSLVSSAIQGLRASLYNFEQSDLLKGLPSESSGVEVKGSKYGYEAGEDFRAKGLTGKELIRTTPRSLSGRTLLSAYANTTPAKGSEVISLAAAIAEVFKKDIKLKPGKKYRRLTYVERLEEDKRVATDIYNFLKEDHNLSNLHKAMTGYAQDNTLMTALAETPAARQVKAKGQELFMQYVTENTVRSGKKKFSIVKTSYTAYLRDTFKYQNTKVELSPTSIDFSYTTKYERAVVEKINKLLSSGLKESLERNLTNTILKESQIGEFLGTVEGVKDQSGKVNFQFKTDVSGSMPIGKIKIPNYTVKRKTSGSAFQSRIGSVRSLLRETRVGTSSMGDFVTDDTITALTKREMLRRMPIGPIGGPPKSSRVLTYRTGRFVNSVQVIADMKSRAMQYYYDPNYWIHEATSRNPRNLIDSSINSVTRSLFGRRFNLVKANQSL